MGGGWRDVHLPAFSYVSTPHTAQGLKAKGWDFILAALRGMDGPAAGRRERGRGGEGRGEVGREGREGKVSPPGCIA